MSQSATIHTADPNYVVTQTDTPTRSSTMPPQETQPAAAEEGAALPRCRNPPFALPAPERFIRRSRSEPNLVRISAGGSHLAQMIEAVNMGVDLADPYDITLEALMDNE